jgi:hypothetical protein
MKFLRILALIPDNGCQELAAMMQGKTSLCNYLDWMDKEK